MNSTKYVEFDDGNVVFFDATIYHNSGSVNPDNKTPISAGFAMVLPNNNIKIFGSSTSLKLDSNKNIDDTINHKNLFYYYGPQNTILATLKPITKYTQIHDLSFVVDEYDQPYVTTPRQNNPMRDTEIFRPPW